MLAVAVGADRNIPDAFDIVLAVDPFQIGFPDPDMAAAACPDDIFSRNRGERIGDLFDAMSSMTVAAVGRHGQAKFLQRLEMNTLLILKDKVRSLLGGHLLEMAFLAGRGKVEGKDGRIIIIAASDIMGPVTVLAPDDDRASFCLRGHKMDALLKLLAGCFVALAAVDWL
jgi:hypothetical protein